MQTLMQALMPNTTTEENLLKAEISSILSSDRYDNNFIATFNHKVDNLDIKLR